jgi:hypothetical protein
VVIGGRGRGDLLAGHFVAAAVDGVQQRLGDVGAGAEELHVLADPHRGHAAGDRGVVSVRRAQQLVVLVLQCAGVQGNLGAEVFEAVGQPGRPQHGQVGLWGGAEVVEGLQVPERRPGDQGAAVGAHPAQRLGHPGRVAGEKLVVRRGAQEPDDAQLDDEVVDQLLGILFGQAAFGQVAFEVDVEERGGATQRHGGAVLLLGGCQVGKVEPLDRLAGRGRRARDVVPVAGSHLLQLAHRPDLLGQLLPIPDHGWRRRVGVQPGSVLLAGGDQPVHAVQRHPPVVADDAAPAVRVRQAGDDVRPPRRPDRLRVRVEDAIVVRLAVAGEDFPHLGVQCVPICGQPVLHHADPAGGHDRTA